MTTAAEQLDHTPLHKGKYIGKTPSQVAERDPAYLVYAYENWSPKPCSELLFKECKKDAEEDVRQRRVAKDQDYE